MDCGSGCGNWYGFMWMSLDCLISLVDASAFALMRTATERTCSLLPVVLWLCSDGSVHAALAEGFIVYDTATLAVKYGQVYLCSESAGCRPQLGAEQLTKRDRPYEAPR